MKFFHFHQNNSGGSFCIDLKNGICPDVIIEARDAAHANERAEEIGIYFNGVEEGLDCGCCGDRWYKQWGPGNDNPCVYGEPVSELNKDWFMEVVAIHYADGRIEVVELRE